MEAYQIKITLKDTHPPIWRRAIIPAGLSFSQCAFLLNEIMGWSGEHLHEFSFGSLGVKLMEQYDDDFFDVFSRDIVLDEKEYIIDEFFDEVNSFKYTYDLGACWEHTVKIEDVIEDYEYNYPQIIKYKGIMPEEDGIGIELLSGEPEYDMDAANKALKKIQVVSTECEPVSLWNIYNEAYKNKGKVKLKKVIVPKNNDDDIDDIDDEWDDVEEAMRFAEVRTVLQIVNNTSLTEEEALNALGMNEEEKEGFRMYANMMIKMEKMSEAIVEKIESEREKPAKKSSKGIKRYK